MDKKIVMILIMAGMILLSIGSNFFIYGQVIKAKDAAREAETELMLAQTKIKALESNKESDLNKIAAEFVKDLFTYDSRDSEKPSDRVMNRVVGSAREKLSHKPEKGAHSEFGEIQGDILSSVVIKEAHYNKTGSDEANVTVQFEQEISLDGIKAKTLNEMKLRLKYSRNEWKISDYSIKQIL